MSTACICRRTIAILATVAAVQTLDAQAQLLPKPDGQFQVGYWRTELAIKPRSLQSGVGAEARTLLLEIWYPSSGRAETVPRKTYTTAPVERALIAQLGLVSGWASAVATHSVSGAPPAAGVHPVVVFSTFVGRL